MYDIMNNSEQIEVFKGNYTGEELEDRLARGTYLDAVKAGFSGTKKDFDESLAKINSFVHSPISNEEIEEVTQNSEI